MATVKSEIKEIKAILADMNDKSVYKAKLYDEQKDRLKNIKLKVEKAAVFFDPSNGVYGVKVEYSAPTALIYITDDGEVVANDAFKSINLLDLISFDDMKKIQAEIDKAIKHLKD